MFFTAAMLRAYCQLFNNNELLSNLTIPVSSAMGFYLSIIVLSLSSFISHDSRSSLYTVVHYIILNEISICRFLN